MSQEFDGAHRRDGGGGISGSHHFFRFRRGLSDEQGMKNMVDGLKKIAGYAEKKRVTLCLEC